ncbi:fimbrillin family protein [Bacteroides timonensis]|uniref:fimbrillin family protein n=1 Tax=Bacteroides timonensis TaxID=1470345 RepID=UPI0004B2917A|nr:fimbrillin family protein [Bacteroides timonensis]
MRYRQQGCKTAIIGLLAGMLLAACTQDELADKQGEPLPEGKYPITFTTTVEGVTATRAATADGQWTTGDKIAVQVDSEVKEYTATPVSGNAATATLSSTSPFYWQNTKDINVSAWYLGTGYQATQPTTWSVKSDQNQNDGYQKSDFLYAPAKNIAFKPQAGTANSLTFYHQTAKVIINIRNKGILTNASKITSVVIGNNNNIALKGTYTAPTDNNTAGTWTSATETADKGTITPKRTSFNADVSFEDGSTLENALASYEALVIPQTVTTGENFIGITVDGTTYYYKAETGKNELKAGYVHTYNITVKGEKLEVTVSNSSMSWETGTSGSGSVELPTIITLGSEAVSISDDGKYLLTGTGSGAVTINGSPTVILNEVTLNTSASPSINITGGSPELTFKGTNTLKTNAGGIFLSNEANVTIKGDGAQNTILKIQGKYGIGVYRDQNKCGNITISDIALNINCEGAGVGSSTNSTCGDISLTRCKLDISTTLNAACIGTSAGEEMYKQICGNIELRDCEIINLTAKQPAYYNFSPAAIGCSGGANKCGNINIYLRESETVDGFLTKITVDGEVDKVGKGSNGYSLTEEIGTVTWYDSTGL